MKSSISILISTYNGIRRISSTLDALSNLDVSDIDFVELIVVDNGSSDGTLAYTQKKWAELSAPFPLICLEESKPGKLFAQETGLQMCTGEYVLICDDDNSLYIDYLKIGLDYVAKNPQIGVLGGRGIAKVVGTLPTWFENYAYFFACAPQASQTGNVFPERNVVYGAGMWLRKKAYDRAKELGFTFLLGSRTGTQLTTGGEDSELCWAIKFQGYEIWYIDEMRFDHYVPSERLTDNYKHRLMEGMGSNGPLANIYMRVWSNNHTRSVSFFWFKELLYSVLEFIRIKLKGNSELGYQKNLSANIWYYLKNRSKFDRAYNQVITFRNNCSVE